MSRQMKLNARPLHVAAFASLAITQPLFDLFGQAPEFLLAHDLGPAEILTVVALLGIALPLACAIVIATLDRAHAATARVIATVMVSLFATLILLYAVKRIPGAVWFSVAIAAAGGITAGVLYLRAAAFRAFASWLVPGIVIIPLIFLLRPGVRSLVWPQEHEVLQSSMSPVPVVVVVFDGLPLSALLDGTGSIDRDLYPSFAAFADQSTWYRNATTVSDYTQWSVPSILSGSYPVRGTLPIASDHPETLFTLLGSSHAVNVYEPISRLCPQSLCDHGGDGIANEMIDFAETVSVAYLHTILSESAQVHLPPIDHGWAEGIPPSERPGEIWLRGGDRSRRGEAVAFINAMEGGEDRPPLHFLHVLLPHTPFAYLPGGQRYGTERSLPGLFERRDRWVDDEWAVAQGYQRFLLQVGYVDTMLGQIVNRLRQIDLYDRALIVVTSDHGASFKPGAAFRRLTDDTFMDIAPIPLLIKEPHQRDGATSDRNIETVDILPTIADIMNVEPLWPLDGYSAVAGAPPRTEKTVYYDDARRVRKFPSSLFEPVQQSVARKLKLFGANGNPHRIPLIDPHPELIGRDVEDLRVSDAADDVEFALDSHGDFANVDLDGPFLPAYMAGRARWRNSDSPAVVAVAINGTVRATTRTYQFEERGSKHSWSLLLPPDAFEQGENAVDVFVVSPSGAPVLHRTHVTHARPVDLLSNAASYGMGVSHEGLYDRRGQGDGASRWTAGTATITVPRDGRSRPRSLRVNLAGVGPVEKDFLLSVNGCEIFEGRVPAARWSRIFALPDCADIDASTVIELRSTTHSDPGSGRELGVAVERIDLLEQPWPPAAAPLPDEGRRSQIRFSGPERDGDSVGAARSIALTVVNRGTSTWAGPDQLGQEHGAIRLGVMWFKRGQTDTPAAVQRVDLPRALLPGDSVNLTFDLTPNTADGKPLPRGEYEAWIGLMQEGVSWFYPSGDSVRKLRVIHDARP